MYIARGVEEEGPSNNRNIIIASAAGARADVKILAETIADERKCGMDRTSRAN